MRTPAATVDVALVAVPVSVVARTDAPYSAADGARAARVGEAVDAVVLVIAIDEAVAIVVFGSVAVLVSRSRDAGALAGSVVTVDEPTAVVVDSVVARGSGERRVDAPAFAIASVGGTGIAVVAIRSDEGVRASSGAVAGIRRARVAVVAAVGRARAGQRGGAPVIDCAGIAVVALG